MRNDQIFVLMLVILLPMSGCFDGTVGDAEGTDDSSLGTTVVNNYYNNTTVVQNGNTNYEFISFSTNRTGDNWGANELVVGGYTYGTLDVGTFNTSSGTIIEVISASALFSDNQSWYQFEELMLTSTCNGITQTHDIRTDNSGTPSTVNVTPLRGTLSSDCELTISVIWFGEEYAQLVEDQVFTDGSTRISIEIGFQVFSASPAASAIGWAWPKGAE